jgi:hypothetical protein
VNEDVADIICQAQPQLATAAAEPEAAASAAAAEGSGGVNGDRITAESPSAPFRRTSMVAVSSAFHALSLRRAENESTGCNNPPLPVPPPIGRVSWNRRPGAYVRPQFGSTEGPIVEYAGWFQCFIVH